MSSRTKFGTFVPTSRSERKAVTASIPASSSDAMDTNAVFVKSTGEPGVGERDCVGNDEGCGDVDIDSPTASFATGGGEG